MNFAEMEKMLESIDDEKVKYCEVCHTPFKPKNKNQHICGSDECKQARIMMYRAKYKANGKQKEYNARKYVKEKEKRVMKQKIKNRIIDYDVEIERLERQIDFDKKVAKYGIYYGRYQAEKTLAMVEPIKKTL